MTNVSIVWCYEAESFWRNAQLKTAKHINDGSGTAVKCNLLASTDKSVFSKNILQ